jgi:hypothetical protein
LNRNNMRIVRKERRRDRRRGLQIEALLGGHLVTLTDLSAAGFGIALDATDRSPYPFKAGQRLRLELELPGREPLRLMVEISRSAGDNGVLGGNFLGLSDSEYNLIESLLTGRFQRAR